MLKVERSIAIRRDVANVFKFVADPANNRRWQPEVIVHEKLTDGPVGIGSRFRHESRFMGRPIRVNGVVERFEPDNLIGFRVQSGTLPYTIAYRVAAEGPDATRFTYSSVADINGALRLMQPLMAIAAARVIYGDLRRLKTLLEHEGTGEATDA